MRVFLFAWALCCVGTASALDLTIYHTNDVHGWVSARPAKLVKGIAEADKSRRIGGLPVLAAYLKAQKGPHLTLDAGDWFSGTPEGSAPKGALVVDLFNAVGYDATVLGNHEFDFGSENAKSLTERLKLPVLGANVYDEKTGRRVDWLKPWILKNVAGVKVGIFGVTEHEMGRWAKAQDLAGLSFHDDFDAAREAVTELRKQGATVIVALTHIGYEEAGLAPFRGDKALAAEVPGIDVIVGGHTHSFLDEPYRDPKNGTLVVQTGSQLTRVGKVTLQLDDKTKKVVASKGELVKLWADQFGEDAEVQKVLDRYVPDIARVYDVAFATAPEALVIGDRLAESVLGDWMADCLRQWGGTDVGLQSYISGDFPSGPVTLRTMLGIMPFENHLVKLTMSGKLLQEVLDHGVEHTHTMIQLSGATMSYDSDKPAGSRILAATVAGKPLDLAKPYTVTAVDFIVNGGDGYSALSRADKKEVSDQFVRDVMIACAKKQGVVKAPLGGRLTNAGKKP